MLLLQPARGHIDWSTRKMPNPPGPASRDSRNRDWGRRKGHRTRNTSSSSQASTSPYDEKWKNVNEPDIIPPQQGSGTVTFDCLNKIKPLYEQIRHTCKVTTTRTRKLPLMSKWFHPKPRLGPNTVFRTSLFNRDTNVFFLAHSLTGYIWDFFV